MKTPVLSFELAPAPALILGCMLPAPLAAVAWCLLLMFGPATGLPDRFAPLSLALVHVMAIAVLMPVMLGALLQLFPVVGGQGVPLMRWIAPCIGPLCWITASALAVGFLQGSASAFQLGGLGASGLLLASLAYFIAGRRIHPVNLTTFVFRHMTWPIAITLIAGIAMAAALSGHPLPMRLEWIDVHAGWALLGWLGTLLLGVSATVLPMFWQTPMWPERARRIVPMIIWIPLLLSIMLIACPLTGWAHTLHIGLASVVTVISLICLTAIWKSRRKRDPAWPLWLFAAHAWLGAALLNAIFPDHPLTPWWTGTLILLGGALVPVNAMLGKIIPFLVFLHLRRLLPPGQRIPAMQTLIKPGAQRAQGYVLMVGVITILALPVWIEGLKTLSALTIAASQLWLFRQLSQAVGMFIRLKRQSHSKANTTC
ncbi:hypothetical protein KSF73_17120 [Burkholderiaceae bacterium DAT-1]|nr:hypothetical protein [Burkholderiaceae bacterium DAT-1]